MAASYEFLFVDPSSKEPLYRQIYQRIKSAIADGVLSSGERLPSLRGVASDLNVARGTVEAAYALLSGEGYIENSGQGGTRVSLRLIAPKLTETSKKLAEMPRHAGMPLPSAQLLPFQLGIPALDAFPLGQWNRLLAQCARHTTREELSHPAPQGYLPLREALAGYLQISRGIRCSAPQIFIAAGYRSALSLIAHAVLSRDDSVWLEEPCFPFPWHVLQSLGVSTIPVPVDDQGICVEQGIKQSPQALAALVTPAHHSPLGLSLSLPRRMQLLAWAQHEQRWILEDDYDGEFHYQGHPLPALKSLDRLDRVLYVGTLSKVLFPGLRIAYVVVPEQLLPQFHQTLRTYPCVCPTLMQATAAQFIHSGQFYRHLKKMRSLYAQRRMWLAQALKQQTQYPLTTELQAGGMHLLVRLPDCFDDTLVEREARVQGLAVEALSVWYHDTVHVSQGIILGFTNVESEEMAQRWVNILLNVLARCSTIADRR